ncbi:MAG: Hercynine oxygenase [Myxococcota bacterium]|nr:Hercynine oxygenase [Myxococcota bacterium]
MKHLLVLAVLLACLAPVEGRAQKLVRLGAILIQSKAPVENPPTPPANRAREAVNRLKSGLGFHTAARIYSEHGESAGRGGDFGWIFLHELPRPLGAALEGAPVGKAVGPVENGAWIWIMRVEERRETAPVDFLRNSAHFSLARGVGSPFRMAFVPAGWFVRGRDDSEADERPARPIYTSGFFLDRFETTNREYRECVTAGVCQEPRRRNWRLKDHEPVSGLTLQDAQTYCSWRGKRLPTEAEWEKAARAGGGRYPWGDEPPDCDQAITSRCGNTPQRVGGRPAGATIHGIQDMSGNVREFVSDGYGEKYYAESPAENPQGPTTFEFQLLRGGSWLFEPGKCDGYTRFRSVKNVDYSDFGVRCALPPDSALLNPAPAK